MSKACTSQTQTKNGGERIYKPVASLVVECWNAEGGVAYPIRGGLGMWCKDQLRDGSYELVAAEFGTVHILKVIHALQAENRAHHYCPPVSITSRRTKEQLRDVFAPRHRTWRDKVVPLGLQIIHQAIEGCLESTSS